MFGLGLPESMIIFGIVALVTFRKIFSKAGFSGWLSLTMIVPFLNIIMLFYLAFAEWPVHRELNRMTQSMDTSHSEEKQQSTSLSTTDERKARIAADLCPKCGNKVSPTHQNCPACGINLVFAREHLDQW